MTTTKGSTTLIFCLVLVFISCNAQVGFNAKDAIGHVVDIIGGIMDPSYKVFNVLDFGAKPDGKEDGEELENTSASFIRAFKAACNHPGKSKLLIPKMNFLLSPVIFSGPCTNSGPLVVQIEGYLKASSDISNFPGNGEEWINFQQINGLIITGGGTFDGQGASSWKLHTDDNANSATNTRSPASLQFSKVNDAVMSGINFINSKGFHIFITSSNNISMFNLNITAPFDSPNTDGIHISKSSTVKVIDSHIGTGDDCVGIIHGASNITVEKVTCGPGHGISVGSLGKFDDETDVKDIFVRNCTLSGTTNGVRIKTLPGKVATKAIGLWFEDICMKDVKNPIIIDQHYQSNNKESIIKLTGIHFKNIWGTSVSKAAVNLECSKLSPCENVDLTDINLQYNGNQTKEPFASKCINAQVGYHGVLFPPVL